ncbi:hypothetical protein BU26DRAFT_490182 [Trematosphaeria pertusa]|uniref:Uncharacterized protein n=1 Tax=Trematosphaeria pertusa TaxID=390896 RepID=A0A6A6I4C8_9PLEO|nr:uncharacterized protein BU26DRAFT_490182 [Trematosphaeria pertusa]KAF2245069.1 hypothetical protein BU26DRAFT_490182 [Trematosphaeria pertusa]
MHLQCPLYNQATLPAAIAISPRPSQPATMSHITPKRVVLRCREQYLREQGMMVEAFFESQNLLNLEDYGVHICGEPSSPTILYLVLDLYCKEIPSVDLREVELQVFKVSKNNTFTFKDLGEDASKMAYQRSLTLDWGANQSNQRS